MAVCRGKVSEGLDFADVNGRAVIVTGLPYPPYRDPRVVLKQEYLNDIRKKDKRGQSGYEWYKLEASRAVNQAIGRVIRHKDDFGAILLADHRFGSGGFISQLSQWVQPHLKEYKDFAPSMRDLTRFFRTASDVCPKPQTKLSYNNKDGKTSSARTSEYDPLPLAPVSSSAFSQAPSRFISKVYGNTATGASTRVEPEVLLPKAFGGPRVATSNTTERQDLKPSAPKSIFEALTDGGASGQAAGKRVRAEQSGILDFNSINVKNAETCATSRYGSLVSAAKKRKFKVTANGSKEEPDNSSGAPTGEASENKSEKVKKIAAYVGEVKKSIPKESYKEFTAAVKSYQASRDYDALLPVFRLFSQPDTRHLLRKFAVFVGTEHRDDFKARCDRLT